MHTVERLTESNEFICDSLRSPYVTRTSSDEFMPPSTEKTSEVEHQNDNTTKENLCSNPREKLWKRQ
jgi:hypothetical protein